MRTASRMSTARSRQPQSAREKSWTSAHTLAAHHGADMSRCNETLHPLLLETIRARMPAARARAKPAWKVGEALALGLPRAMALAGAVVSKPSPETRLYAQDLRAHLHCFGRRVSDTNVRALGFGAKTGRNAIPAPAACLRRKPRMTSGRSAGHGFVHGFKRRDTDRAAGAMHDFNIARQQFVDA